MSATRTSFWRDSSNLFVLYVMAGIAAVPAGTVYALLAAGGWDRWWTTFPLLSVGVGSALLTWSFCEKRWFTSLGERLPRSEQHHTFFEIQQANPPKNSQ